MRHTLLVTTLALSCGVFATGCGQSRSGSSRAASTVAGATSGSVAPGTSATIAPFPIGPLTPALQDRIAETFAPQLRFNAYFNDGSTSLQNRSEDFFPVGVAEFLDEIESGQGRVLVQGSSGANPGISEIRPHTDAPVLGAAFGTYPRNLVGDVPGQAPLYVHVYEDTAASRINADGSGELVAFVEYWVFYAQDRADAILLGLLPTTGAFDLTGHRADWEHTSFGVRVQLGFGGVYVSGALESGVFWGHSKKHWVDGADLETVDDAGAPSPTGLHPIVYVSQGKHASYPQAGEFRNPVVPGWVARHTDYFRGNGVTIDSWRVPLHNLEDTVSHPQVFSPASFAAVVARSPNTTLADWSEYQGKWGPDLTLISAPSLSIRIGTSASGPKAKSHYGDFNGRGSYPQWSDTKAAKPNLIVYVDRGISIPRSANAAPIRR